MKISLVAPKHGLSMETPSADLEMLRSFRASCASVLKEFAASPLSFKLVRTIRPAKSPPETIAKTLYVLDGSFNPPTTAHHRIATSALLDENCPEPKRILLLLATQNADKAKKGASFEDRLVMMTLSAHELLHDAQHRGEFPVLVDIGLVKHPYFHDKAAAIDECDAYPSSLQQVHLVGFDTLIRILNTKYYPPDHNLRVLEPFLSKHRLRATYRGDDEWGSKREQDQYVQDIADGKRLHEGAQPKWARQLSLCEGRRDDEDTVSSTLARKAAKHDLNQLDKHVMPTIRGWIMSERLYMEDN